MHAYDLICQNPATWNISRISHEKPGNRTCVFDDSAGECTYTCVIGTGIFVDHPGFSDHKLSS